MQPSAHLAKATPPEFQLHGLWIHSPDTTLYSPVRFCRSRPIMNDDQRSSECLCIHDYAHTAKIQTRTHVGQRVPSDTPLVSCLQTPQSSFTTLLRYWVCPSGSLALYSVTHRSAGSVMAAHVSTLCYCSSSNQTAHSRKSMRIFYMVEWMIDRVVQ